MRRTGAAHLPGREGVPEKTTGVILLLLSRPDRFLPIARALETNRGQLRN
jgi:hypothetical protein